MSILLNIVIGATLGIASVLAVDKISRMVAMRKVFKMLKSLSEYKSNPDIFIMFSDFIRSENDPRKIVKSIKYLTPKNDKYKILLPVDVLIYNAVFAIAHEMWYVINDKSKVSNLFDTTVDMNGYKLIFHAEVTKVNALQEILFSVQKVYIYKNKTYPYDTITTSYGSEHICYMCDWCKSFHNNLKDRFINIENIPSYLNSLYGLRLDICADTKPEDIKHINVFMDLVSMYTDDKVIRFEGTKTDNIIKFRECLSIDDEFKSFGNSTEISYILYYKFELYFIGSIYNEYIKNLDPMNRIANLHIMEN